MTGGIMESADVLNGVVSKGHRVAFSTRTGSRQEMNLAEVTEIVEADHPWKQEPVTKLRVRVYVTSGYRAVPRHVVLTELHRVVKLG